MTYSLICEGPCNPERRTLDDAVRAERHESRGGSYQTGNYEPVSAAIAARLRALRHTPHLRLSATHAKCLDCGSQRVWGSVGA